MSLFVAPYQKRQSNTTTTRTAETLPDRLLLELCRYADYRTGLVNRPATVLRKQFGHDYRPDAITPLIESGRLERVAAQSFGNDDAKLNRNILYRVREWLKLAPTTPQTDDAELIAYLATRNLATLPTLSVGTGGDCRFYTDQQQRPADTSLASRDTCTSMLSAISNYLQHKRIGGRWKNIAQFHSLVSSGALLDALAEALGYSRETVKAALYKACQSPAYVLTYGTKSRNLFGRSFIRYESLEQRQQQDVWAFFRFTFPGLAKWIRQQARTVDYMTEIGGKLVQKNRIFQLYTRFEQAMSEFAYPKFEQETGISLYALAKHDGEDNVPVHLMPRLIALFDEAAQAYGVSFSMKVQYPEAESVRVQCGTSVSDDSPMVIWRDTPSRPSPFIEKLSQYLAQLRS